MIGILNLTGAMQRYSLGAVEAGRFIEVLTSFSVYFLVLLSQN